MYKMFEISLGESCILMVFAITIIGSKDLPPTSRFIGKQIGRVVGFLQGARIRADKFAADNALKSLQNDLKSGLRELDAIKREMSMATSSKYFVGKDLGGLNQSFYTETPSRSILNNIGKSVKPINSGSLSFGEKISAPEMIDSERNSSTNIMTACNFDKKVKDKIWNNTRAPIKQTIAAVAEEEWERQGIGFRSKAEIGAGIWTQDHNISTENILQKGGSSILKDVIQHNLIFDQYNITSEIHH